MSDRFEIMLQDRVARLRSMMRVESEEWTERTVGLLWSPNGCNEAFLWGIMMGILLREDFPDVRFVIGQSLIGHPDDEPGFISRCLDDGLGNEVGECVSTLQVALTMIASESEEGDDDAPQTTS
jgi:hypothetical protein